MTEGLRYIQAGEVMIPDLTTVEEKMEIGRYGRMRERYLKENRKGLYSVMVLQGTLNRHLYETNEQVNRRMDVLMQQLAKKDPGPDKALDQMGWVRHQNSLRQQAEELILGEMIYS